MIRAAIVGIGWWGRTLVNAVQGKSAAIRFTAGYTRTRATAEGFCAEHSIALAHSTRRRGRGSCLLWAIRAASILGSPN